MKILTLHVDYIKFKPLKKALKSIPDLKDKKEKSVKDALVVLTAVEKGDSKNIVSKFVSEIKDIAKQVKTKNIVLYPYAHLSSNLGNPEAAKEVLEETEKALKGFKVTRAPFGYYKEFELKVKGHPLSELSRSISSEGKVEEEKYDIKQLLREVSKTKLDTSKLKENDHRIIGKQMDLFSFHDVAPGMVFLHNNGLIIFNELIDYWREMHKKGGYREISTPFILDSIYLIFVPLAFLLMYTLNYIYQRFDIKANFLTAGWIVAAILLFVEVVIAFFLSARIIAKKLSEIFPHIFPVDKTKKKKEVKVKKEKTKKRIRLRKEPDYSIWENEKFFVKYTDK